MDTKDPHPPSHELPGSAKAIICVYAQPDEAVYHALQSHLFVWQHKGVIRWLDLLAGTDVERTLFASIQQADLILLLISADFFVPRQCRTALDQALAEHEKRGVLVIPVLVRACLWKESECGTLSALPKNERPIVEWQYPERAYEEIRAGIARALGLTSQAATLSGRPRLFQARDLPTGYIARPKAFASIKQLLLNRQSNQTTTITTALRGAGGFGKTTLALALCHDPEIQAAFPDGILWVELGERPPQALDLLKRLLTLYEEPSSEALTLQEAQERWQFALRDRACLLVIDDVWQQEALSPLLQGGAQCRHLVTTRNDVLLPRSAVRVIVDAMTLPEAVQVLCQDEALPAEIAHPGYRPHLEALVARLGYWPLLLTLARGMLTDLVVEAHSTIAEALTTLAEAYETCGVTAFRLDNVEERQRTVDACLNVSFQHLETFTHAHYRATERYRELAVFPEDTDIPLSTLQVYWKSGAGLQPWETKDLCMRLHRLSLLLTCDLGTGVIRLHDVLRSYLIQRAGSHLPALHARLLDASWRAFGLTRWADLPRSEAYLWQHLIHHLCQAGHLEALQSTLTDLRYLMGKALYLWVPALEADFLVARTAQQKAGNEAAASLLMSLVWTIRRISHRSLEAQTPAEIGGLLLSHLGAYPSFAAQRSVFERELPRPFLTTWHPLPDGSSSALLRTLSGHINGITSCAVSPDGCFIVSASWDDMLKVWDVASGAERLTLTGHTAMVSGCAVSPDGRFIVSASYDQTLKLWDVASGAELLTLTGHTHWVSGCAVSPDGRFIVSASADQTLKVWDAASGAELLTLTGHTSAVSGCAVSPDGRFIVSASYDQTLKLWDVASGAERLTLSGHTAMVRGCAVSPDGRFIVSASWDQTLKVWDAASGLRLLTFPVDGLLSSCTFYPDGEHLVAFSVGGMYFLRLVA